MRSFESRTEISHKSELFSAFYVKWTNGINDIGKTDTKSAKFISRIGIIGTFLKSSESITKYTYLNTVY